MRYVKASTFGAISLNENADIDRYKYSGYGIVFDRHGHFSFLIIFGVNMSSSTKTDKRKKDNLKVAKGPTQGLEHTLSAEKCVQLILQSTIKSSV